MNNKKKLAENPWLIFVVTGWGVALASIDSGIVNVALPTITKQLSNAEILLSQWTVSGYILLICLFLPLSGKLGDIYSRRNVYLSGFMLFTFSSLLCGISFSIQQLILFRCLQGLGASMLLANNQALIITTIPKEKQGKALGINSMITAVGSITGPGLGGLILHYLSWRYIFFVNIPLGITACILGYKILPRIKQKIEIKIDIFGSVLFALGLSSLLLFLTNINSWQWSSWQFLCILTILIVSSFSFFFWEKKITNPMINFALFKTKAFSVSLAMALCVSIALATNNILLPFFLDSQLNLASASIGLIMLIPPIFIVIVAPISGHLADKHKQKFLIGSGLFCLLLALFNQSQLTSDTNIYRIIFSQCLLGIGFGLFQSPNNFKIMTSIPINSISSGNSIAALTRNLGKISGTVSSTVIFAVTQNYLLFKHFEKNHAFSGGFELSLLTAATLILSAIIIFFTHMFKDKQPLSL